MVKILILGEVSKRLAERDITDSIEGKELRLFGQVNRARLTRRRGVLAIDEGYEVEQLAIKACLETKAFILLSRILEMIRIIHNIVLVTYSWCHLGLHGFVLGFVPFGDNIVNIWDYPAAHVKVAFGIGAAHC
jgi:hypothetical protein